MSQLIASIVILLALAGLAAFAATRLQLPGYHAQIAEQQRAAALALQLHPDYRAKAEEDRRYLLDSEQQRADIDQAQQKLSLERDRFNLERSLALSRVTVDQYGTYLIDIEPSRLLHLAPVLKPMQIAAPVQASPSPDGPTLPSPVDAYTLLKSGLWHPSKDNLLLAVGPQGPIFVALALAWHVALAGATGNGKTNMLRLLLAQLVKFYETYYISPAFAPIKANHEDWRQIESRLAGPVACEAREIEARLTWAVEVYRYRQEQEREGDFTWRHAPIYIVIDEYIACVKRYPGAADDVGELLRFARQYQVFVIVASQDFLIKNIGGDSGARDCYRTALYFGGDPTTARTLLDITGTLPYEQQLGNQGMLVLRTKSTQVTQARAPFMSNRAIYELLGWPEDPILDDAPVQGGTYAPAYGTPDREPLYPPSTGTRYPTHAMANQRYQTPTTGTLATVIEADREPTEHASDQVPASTDDKEFTPEQEMQFTRFYRASGSIKASLAQMHLSYGRYQRCASRLVAARKLRKAR